MVETLNIKGTEDSPEVIMDYGRGFIRISGTSWLEDAYSFYEPLYQWVSDYFKAPQKVTKIEFYFTYFNTSSAKQIAKLVTLLSGLKAKSDVRVKWFYEKDDNEMFKSGKKYSELLNLDFEFIETEVIDESDEEEGVYKIIKK